MVFPKVPSTVEESVKKRWPDRADTWLATVEADLSAVCVRYQAEPVRTFKSRYGFVIEIQTKAERLVIRSTPDPDGLLQATVMRSLAQLGVGPLIYEITECDTGTLTVTQRITPGVPAWGRSISLETLSETLRPLRGQPAPANGMPALDAWLSTRIEDDYLEDLPPGRLVAPREERERAHDLLMKLNEAPLQDLCHGDASPGNILMAGGGRLALVDPRGISGETAYDVAIAALKVAPADSRESYAAALAERTGVSPTRVTDWLTVAKAARV